MPKKPLPPEVKLAIALHLETAHPGARFDLAETGMRTARRATIKVTWEPEQEERGASFRCRRCPDGFDFYLVELEAQVPSARIVELIRKHFREEHELEQLPARAIYHAENRPKNPLAIYQPMLASRGAGILCQLCPQFQNNWTLTPPPYGDARRLRYLTQVHSELWSKIAGRETREQAAYLDAFDRGLLVEEEHKKARRALKRTPSAKVREPEKLERVVLHALEARFAAGEPITKLITRLADLAKKRPVQFSCAIGREQPGLARVADQMLPREFAKRVAELAGVSGDALPRIGKSRLWQIWSTR